MGDCACMCAVMHGAAVDVRPQEASLRAGLAVVCVIAYMHMCEAPSYSA